MRLFIAVVALIVAACSGPSATHYEAVLDELSIPATWELVHSSVTTPDTDNGCSTLMGSCPRVARYFLVDGQPLDALADAKKILIAAGFEVQDEFGPQCDLPPGSAACVLVVVRGADLLQLSLFKPGVDTEGLGLAQPDRTLIRLVAEPK